MTHIFISVNIPKHRFYESFPNLVHVTKILQSLITATCINFSFNLYCDWYLAHAMNQKTTRHCAHSNQHEILWSVPLDPLLTIANYLDWCAHGNTQVPSSDIITSLCGYSSVSEAWKVSVYVNGGACAIWDA